MKEVLKFPVSSISFNLKHENNQFQQLHFEDLAIA
jgi:hypothetical protein